MNKKWIGEEVNTSGSYYDVEGCSELSKRNGGFYNAKKLYIFKSRFGEEYYIADDEVINQIEELLEKVKSSEIYEYLYNLVIQKFGVIEFIVRIGHKIAEQRDVGYREGKIHLQKEVKKVLGL